MKYFLKFFNGFSGSVGKSSEFGANTKMIRTPRKSLKRLDRRVSVELDGVGAGTFTPLGQKTQPHYFPKGYSPAMACSSS
jgi:hypothetical protein